LPALASHVKGPVDVNLRGRIGPEWDGSGGATLTRGQVFGLDVTEWRVPMQFSFVPAQGSGELTVRDSSARIAQGRARLDSTLNWGNGLRLTGTLLFYQVDLRTLLRHSPELSSYASGRVSGRIDLSGNEMRSINDLNAVVQAQFKQGQALQLPVLRQITPYLRPGVSSATFQSGELKGRLAGSIFRVQRLTLVGNLLQLIIEGTVTLAGNLNLDVTAQTGAFCLNASQANALGSRVPLVGAIPRVLLAEASALLANRVVHLRVTGTVRSPSIRLEPILLLTEEAIRFFLGRLTRLPIPTVP
jgi:translocation and assembly module TamB